MLENVGTSALACANTHLQLLDGLSTLANDQASLASRDHDLLHCAILTPIGVVVELSWGAPTAPRHDIIQHHLCLSGKIIGWHSECASGAHPPQVSYLVGAKGLGLFEIERWVSICPQRSREKSGGEDTHRCH